MSRDRLADAIAGSAPRFIAVSGGVDSMTLATFVHRHGDLSATMVHAVSPAVPAAATARVRQLAATEGWDLAVVDSGEFDDPQYRANPVNRCYFCKSNLYARISGIGPGRIASGANLDDLGDYRPGLTAAAEHDVVHPYVDAKMDKEAVRALARELDLTDVAELPAQPCLASRIRTGIEVDARDLAFVEKMETTLAPMVDGGDLRCRIVPDGVVIEVGQGFDDRKDDVSAAAAGLCASAGRRLVGVRPYTRGAMFVAP